MKGVSLKGEMVFPAADLLIERGTPFAFTTGFDQSVIPSRFSHVIRCEKPVPVAKIIKVLERALGPENCGASGG